MARQVFSFAILIPTGTLKSANFSSPMTFPDREVQEIEIRVPPGPRGEVGFAIGSSGVAILPTNAGAFIVTDDERINWPVEEQHDSGSWTLFGYNTGQFDHTIYVRFLVTMPGSVTQAQAGAGVASPLTIGSFPVNPPVTPVPVPPSLPVAPVPPTPPPPPAPTQLGLPLLLPPSLPTIGTQPVKPVPQVILLGVQELAQVWLLGAGRYQRVLTFEDMNRLLRAGIPGVAVSIAFHQLLVTQTEHLGLEAILGALLGGRISLPHR